MIPRKILDLLECPACRQSSLVNGSARRPTLDCDSCGHTYAVVDGIPELVDPEHRREPGSYRTETLFDAIAGLYDYAAPAMSVGVWNCDPLRYVDSENRALGRGNGGVYLEVPSGTGLVLDRVLAEYHDVTILLVDSSRKMLRKARKRLEGHPQTIQLIRAEPSRLPVRSGVVDSVQSLNGLHTFTDRVSIVREMLRIARPEGFISGTAIVRGERAAADLVLERFERYGVFPLLRRAHFLIEELKASGLENVHWETHGAALFFTGDAPSV